MHWKGYWVCIDEVSGALGYDEAIRLHGEQSMGISLIDDVMPGQKNEASAPLVNIWEIPWWAEWSALRTFLSRLGELLCGHSIQPSHQKWLVCLCIGNMVWVQWVGRSSIASGNPFSMRSISLIIEFSLLVATWISFQVIELTPKRESSSLEQNVGISGCVPLQ